MTCLEQVNDYIWAGTERGKLGIWDLDEEEPVKEALFSPLDEEEPVLLATPASDAPGRRL